MILSDSLSSRTYTQALTSAAGLLIPGFVLAVILGVCLFALDSPPLVFRSPDESSEFLFTAVLAESGKPYYESDLIRNDAENLLHARGVLTHEGRAVPVKYFGLSVLYAPVYLLLGQDVRYVALPLAALTVYALAGIGSLISPGRPWLAWLACLALAPVLYYLGRPLMNATPALAFTSLGVFFLLRHFRDGKPALSPYFLLGSASLALAAFMRYEIAIFATLFVAILLLHRHGSHLSSAVRHFAVYLGVLGLLFLVPVLALNYWTYGSPTEFGYSLFNQAYFPERWSSESGYAMSLLQQARGILLPAYPLDPVLASRSFAFQVVGVMPVVALIAFAGLVILIIRREVPLRFVGLYVALGFYVFIYRGAGESWLAGTATPSLEASVVRYSLPLYIGLYCLLVYALARIRRWEMAAAFVAVLAIAGIYGTVWQLGGNVSHVRTQLLNSERLVTTRILPNTEPDSLIYTDVFDKLLISRREVATWWGSAGKNEISVFDPSAIATSIARNAADRPVYLLLGDVGFFLPPIDAALREHALMAQETQAGGLYRVVSTAEAPP